MNKDTEKLRRQEKMLIKLLYYIVIILFVLNLFFSFFPNKEGSIRIINIIAASICGISIAKYKYIKIKLDIKI